MVYTQAPSNDRLRQAFLNTLVARAETDQTDGKYYLTGSLLNQAVRLRDNLTQAVAQQNAAYRTRVRAVQERDQHLVPLMAGIRQAWTGVYFRLRREDRLDWSTHYYKLPFDGKRPKLSKIVEWVEATEAFLAGEVAAVADGLPAMSNPSAEELTALLDLVKQGNKAISDAKEAVKETAETLESTRTAIHLLWQEIARYFRFAQGKLRPSQRREVMRRYGYIFKGKPGQETTPTTGEETPGGDSPSEEPTSGETNGSGNGTNGENPGDGSTDPTGIGTDGSETEGTGDGTPTTDPTVPVGAA